LQSLADSRHIRTWMANCAKCADAYVIGKAAGIRCLGSMPARKCGCRNGGEVDIRTGRERIATHGKSQRKHSVLTFPPHHQGIPLGARRAEGKILIHLRQSAPEVEKRSLAAYERMANGGGR